jgi:hypothetical protein
MKTLVTHQFNSAMLKLNASMQQEVSTLFSYCKTADKEHLVASPLTQIASENNDIFTLRGNLIRIFCTFSMEDGNESIVFLDVKPANSYDGRKKQADLRGEVTLFGSHGEPIAYIEDSSDKTIFTFNGEPTAYIDEANNVYGFNGRHMGWYEDQIIWDHTGSRVGFTKNTCPTYTQFEPFKGFKQFKPFRAFKQFAPFKPMKNIHSLSNTGLLQFLKAGR